MPSDLAGRRPGPDGAPRPAASWPDAVLLDMDGTLVDTEGLWWQAVDSIAATLGRPLTPDDVPEILGRTADDVAAHLLRDTAARGGAPGASMAERLTDAFAARVAANVTIMPGARELLAELAAAAIPTALVSASERRVIDLVLPRLGHPFDQVIANEDTVRGKPHPDPYLEATRRLGASPARCVAIEDSPAGVAAATAAGCHVLLAGPAGLPSLARVRASLPLDGA